MQVRYQAAPRSDTIVLIEIKTRGVGTGRAEDQSYADSRTAPAASAPQNLHELLELDAHLLDDLLALRHIRARLFPGELVACPANGEALIVEQASDLADDDHVLALVIAAVAAALHRLQLRKFLFPVAQHVRLDTAQLTYLSDGEVALAGNRRQLRVILWLQHTLRPVPLVFALGGMSPRVVR